MDRVHGPLDADAGGQADAQCLPQARAVVAVVNDSRGRVARRKRRYTPADVGVSAIVMHQMWVGAYKCPRAEHNLGVVDNQREFVRVTGLTTVDWAA